MLDREFSIDTQSRFLWHFLPWLAAAILLFFSLALLYRFGPNLKDRRWQWSIPGAVIAVAVWVASTILLRVYQNHFGSQRIYGGLDAVVALLLWLYFTGAAVFIGGEANSEIEKAASKAQLAERGGPVERRSGGELR
jgi:membrane protein